MRDNKDKGSDSKQILTISGIWARLLFSAFYCIAGLGLFIFLQEDLTFYTDDSVIEVSSLLFRYFGLVVLAVAAGRFYTALKDWRELKDQS